MEELLKHRMDMALDRFCRSWYGRIGAGSATDGTVHHYTGAEGLLGILRDRQFRATNIAFLNDSAEYYLSLERIAAAVARYSEGADAALRPFLDDMAERLRGLEDTLPPVYVTSFSRAADLLSQWRGYGEVESGYALGFDLAGLSAGLQWPGAVLAPCVYEETAQDAFANELVETVADLWRQCGQTGDAQAVLLDVAFGRLAWFAALFKHPGFSEEREWRLIRLIGAEEVDELRFFARATCIASYLPAPYDPATLREVWIGPSRHQHLSVPAISALLRQQGFPDDVRILRSTVPFRLV